MPDTKDNKTIKNNKKTGKNEKAIKNKNLNVKITEEDYEMLQSIASKIGDMSLSSMIRAIIQNKLDRYKKTNDPTDFIK